MGKIDIRKLDDYEELRPKQKIKKRKRHLESKDNDDVEASK